KLSPIDRVVSHGDVVNLGEHTAQVIDVSGHTNGHVAFHIIEEGIAFVGDAVFALGCGRMFEGEPKQFWDSLDRIRRMPTATTLYCAHEYTQANAKFAIHADPENAELQAYVEEIDAKRANGEWTVPTVLSRELATNPFLRADDPAIVAKWGGSAPHETFAALRAGKDTF
ncbi:MAG: hydroxyacylglutathione hydrolase, partial [Pseudomonadota bacterium]